MGLVAGSASLVWLGTLLVATAASRRGGSLVVGLVAVGAVRVCLGGPGRKHVRLLIVTAAAALEASFEAVSLMAFAAACVASSNRDALWVALLFVAVRAAARESLPRAVYLVTGTAIELCRVGLAMPFLLNLDMAACAVLTRGPLVGLLCVRRMAQAAGLQVAMNHIGGDGLALEHLSETPVFSRG
jgi:hypothetical protein